MKFCHWLKLVASNSVGQNYVWIYANENHSLILLGAKVPSLQMSLCSFLFRVSLFPRCKLILQISEQNWQLLIYYIIKYSDPKPTPTLTTCNMRTMFNLLIMNSFLCPDLKYPVIFLSGHLNATNIDNIWNPKTIINNFLSVIISHITNL